MHDKSRGSASKQVADVAGTGSEGETKEKNSIIRYEPAEGAAGRKAANNEGGIEQMLHVGGGRREGGARSNPAPNAATCHLPFLPSLEKPMMSFQNSPNIYPVTQTERNVQLRSRKDQAAMH